MEPNLTLFINNRCMQIKIPNAYSYCTLKSNNTLVLTIQDDCPTIIVDNDACYGFIDLVDKIVDRFNCSRNDLHYDDLEDVCRDGSYLGHNTLAEGLNTIFINTQKFSLSGEARGNYTDIISFKQCFNAICIIPAHDYDDRISKLIFTYIKEKPALNNVDINTIDTFSLCELVRIIDKNLYIFFDIEVDIDKLLAKSVEHAFIYNDYSSDRGTDLSFEFKTLCETFVRDKLRGNILK